MLTVGAGQGGIFARTRPELATPDVQFHIVLFSADRPGHARPRLDHLPAKRHLPFWWRRSSNFKPSHL